MNFNDRPVRTTPGRLRLSSRRARVLGKSGVSVAASAGEEEAAGVSPLAALGDAIASLYVGVARRVLLGVEAIEDRRAEARPAAAGDPSASARAPQSRRAACSTEK